MRRPPLFIAALISVLSITAARAQIETIASFDGANGNGPLGGLILGGNTLYGTTSYGGAKDDGTVFSVPVSGGTPTTLASFNDSTSGTGIFGNLVLVGSILCGTTHAGELRLYQWV